MLSRKILRKQWKQHETTVSVQMDRAKGKFASGSCLTTKLHIIVGGNGEGVLKKHSHDDFDHRKSHGRLKGEDEDGVELTYIFLVAVV